MPRPIRPLSYLALAVLACTLAIGPGCAASNATKIYQVETGYLAAVRVVKIQSAVPGRISPAVARTIIKSFGAIDLAIDLAKAHVNGGPVFDAALSAAERALGQLNDATQTQGSPAP